MKTSEFILLLVIGLLIACLALREPAQTIIVLVLLEAQPDQPKTGAAVHPEPAPKFHGFALA
jgi:hypothetical protein